jgi:hypothetical protein
VNVVFIGLGAEVVFMGLGIPLMADYNGDGVTDITERQLATRKQRWLRRFLLVFAVVFSIPCIYYTQDKISVTLTEGNLTVVQDSYKVEFTTAQLKALIDDYVDYYVADEHFFNSKTQALETRVVATVVCNEIPDERTQGKVEELILLNSTNISNVVFMKKVGDQWLGDAREVHDVIEEEVIVSEHNVDEEKEKEAAGDEAEKPADAKPEKEADATAEATGPEKEATPAEPAGEATPTEEAA